jgi:NADH-quinone oxidoreductase subunit G
MPKLTINDIEVEVEPGTSILQAAEQIGVEIPRFCYHDRLSVPANCRMCLVEVTPGPPKPAASCAMACGEGMVVKTESDMVQQARKGVMEMLLINHPLDCPICDQGGECDLQDQAVAYGFDRSRYHENKRAVKDKELGPLINTSMNRCINCTRCVRFAEEIAGTPVLGQFHRGEEAEIGTFIDKIVDTELSGNMIDICPVGALTSKPYQFKARPWELRKVNSIDVHDAVGCNIRVDARGREVMRVLPRLNEEINEEWINDRSRFAYDGLNKARLDRPYIRDGKNLREASWDEAFAYIAKKMKKVKGDEVAGLVGDLAAVEDVVALKDFLGGLGSPNMDCRTDGGVYDSSQTAGYVMNSGIEVIESADAILLVGTNPRYEATLVDTRIRKAVRENRAKVGLIGEAADLTYKYEHLGSGASDIEALVKARSGFAKILKDAQRPVMIVGAGAFARKDGAAVQALLRDAAEKLKIVRKDWNGFNVLQSAASRVGALNVGFVPQKGGKGFADILAGTKDGSIKALFMVGADEFSAAQEIGWKCLTVYIGHHGDHGAQRADVILPGCAYTEKDGIYVNTEGRSQLARRAVTPPGDAREDWAILRALSAVLGEALPYNTPVQLRARIAQEWPALVDFDVRPSLEWKAFGDTKGKVLKAGFAAGAAFNRFYMGNAICRASDTMRKCVAAFNEPKMLEAAE